MPIEDVGSIELSLKNLGAKLIGYTEEHDYYIDTRPCVDLASADSALRIRVSRDLQSNNYRYELTFKGPREKHEFAKVRREITVEVSDGEKLLEIFKIVGFKVLAVVSKKRKIYQYGTYRVYLDEVEGLGKFIEIEYVGDDRPRIEIEYEIMHIIDTLNIPRKIISKSYLELVLAKTKS